MNQNIKGSVLNMGYSYEDKRKRPIFAVVVCKKRDDPVKFIVSMKSLKNNENLCHHCPKRKECSRRLNVHIKPYDMLRISPKVPKEIIVG